MRSVHMSARRERLYGDYLEQWFNTVSTTPWAREHPGAFLSHIGVFADALRYYPGIIFPVPNTLRELVTRMESSLEVNIQTHNNRNPLGGHRTACACGGGDRPTFEHIQRARRLADSHNHQGCQPPSYLSFIEINEKSPYHLCGLLKSCDPQEVLDHGALPIIRQIARWWQAEYQGSSINKYAMSQSDQIGFEYAALQDRVKKLLAER